MARTTRVGHEIDPFRGALLDDVVQIARTYVVLHLINTGSHCCYLKNVINVLRTVVANAEGSRFAFFVDGLKSQLLKILCVGSQGLRGVQSTRNLRHHEKLVARLCPTLTDGLTDAFLVSISVRCIHICVPCSKC